MTIPARACGLAAAALLAWAGAMAPAVAQSCLAEAEPNDEPAAAGGPTGAFCLAGAAQGGDRDWLSWTVDEAGSAQLWALSLEGLPGQGGRLMLARVEVADDGSSRESEVLNEAIEPETGRLSLPPLLLAPGGYAIRIEGSYGDGLLYRLRATPGSALPAALPASGVTGGLAGALLPRDDERTAIPWTIDEAASGRLWTLSLQAELGATPRLEIRNEAGESLTRAYSQTGAIARLADLGLDPGTYEITIGSRGGARLLLSAIASGSRDPGREREPNEEAPDAVPLDPGQPLTGRLVGSQSQSDDDLLRLSLDETWRDQRFDLVLRADAADELRLQLLDAEEQTLQERTGNGEVRLPGLVLAPGEHLLRIRGTLDPAITYTVTVEDRSPAPPASEREPNDTAATASPAGPEGVVEGYFHGQEWDMVALTVEGAPELWRVEAEGQAVERLALHDSSGSVIVDARRSGDEQRMRLSNLLLVPGRHLFGVQGTDGEYRLTATRLGFPPAPGTPIAEVLANGLADELEPNDDPARAIRLEPGVARSGMLDRQGDVDLYRFFLAAETRVRITLSGPPATRLIADLSWGEQHGGGPRLRTAADTTGRSELVWEGMLGVGDHYLPLRTDAMADGPYAVLLEHRPYFERPTDLEPNDEWWQAGPLPDDLRISGTLFPQDSDWYRLPDLDGPAVLVIRDLAPDSGTLAGAGPRIVQATPTDPADPWPAHERSTVASPQFDREAGEWRAELPAGSDYRLGIGGGSDSGAYSVGLDFGGAVDPRPVTRLPVTATLQLDAHEVAGFSTLAQRVDGTLILSNQGSSPLSLALLTHAGDQRWQVSPAETRVELAAGASADVPIAVEIAPDAWAGRAVTIAVAAQAGGGPLWFAEAVVIPTLTAEAVGPHRAWPVPEGMLGGLDVAAAAAGGATASEPRLIDGGVNQATNAELTQNELRQALPVIDLAGEDPVTLAGVLLTPAALPSVGNRLRRFAISTSLDGVDFQRVLEASLSPRPAEQAFSFAQPVAARYLRLEPIDVQGGARDGYGASLGEIKAVAVPASNPLDPQGIGLNLAAPDRGGHVVWSQPAFQGRHLLTAESERPRVTLASDHTGSLEWVVAFAHNRAARITAVEWLSSDAEPEEQLASVEVSASLDSAVGPWQPLGNWQVPAGASMASFRFDEPVWARYLRFTAVRAEGARTQYLPETLVVREQPVGADYRSALGEWGELGRDAVHEWLEPAAAIAMPEADDNDTPETADPLVFDIPAAGTVQVERDVDWYRVDVPADGRGIVVTLTGTPSVDVTVGLQDAAGREITLSRETAGPGEQRLAAAVTSGVYWLRIEDPPRSVAIAWDTSGSVSGFVPWIVQAMRTFASGLRPGHEVVNLFPFRGPGTMPLLDEWTGDPLTVFLTLHGYDWQDNSSNAEAGLLAASEALADRPGLRAIVLLTDAQSDGADLTPALWAQMAATQPRVFALGVPGGFTGEELWTTRNLMQDWAGLNGGFYQQMLSQGEIDVAFDRLAGWLRRPAAYQVAVALDRTPPPPPEPAFLQLVAADRSASDGVAAPAEGGILLILDASGSMLQRIDGVRRIEIAKQRLAALTGATIPPGTLLGLRVFGQGPPDSCETGLVLPPQPLDPQAISSVIAGIQPTNLARTPIGESLRQVPEDMASVTGQRLVVLITDGEETCDGDPAGEIAALREMGIDVRINIVGFALDDPVLAETFRAWAALGGGRYFDATDAATLGEALTQAVQPSFTVENSRGTIVATGTVGDPPIELPPGTYRIGIDGGGATRVAVRPGETVTITAPF